MQAVVGLNFGAWLVLWLSLFAFLKIRFPDSAVGQVLTVIC